MKIFTLYVKGERWILELDNSKNSPVTLDPKLITIYFEVTLLRITDQLINDNKQII